MTESMSSAGRRGLNAFLVLVLCAGAVAPAAGAQEVDTDSLRRAHLAEVQRHQRLAAAAAAALTDTLAGVLRLDALRGVEVLVEPEHVSAATAILLSTAEPVELRVRALQLVGHRMASDARLLRGVLSLLGDARAAAALRREAATQIEALMVHGHAAHGENDPVLSTLRELLSDRDEQVRRTAFRVLAAHCDPMALRLLEEGLLAPGQGPLPPSEMVQMLGFVDPAPHFPVLRQVLRTPPDPESRVLAVTLLGGDDESRGELVRIFQSSDEPEPARHAALLALLANDPESFSAHAHPVVADESAPSGLRVRAIRGVELRRTTRDAAVLQRRGDRFDSLVAGLAERSADPEVRRAAARYAVRTRSPH